MYLKLRITLGILIVIGLTVSVKAQQEGSLPIPVLKNVRVQSQVAYDAGTGLYTYNYTITNPATNTGEIDSIHINITRPSGSPSLSSYGLTIPRKVRIRTFDEVLSMGRDAVPIIPIGMR